MTSPPESVLFNFRLLDGTSIKASIPSKVALENLQNYIRKRTQREFPNSSSIHKKIYESHDYYFNQSPENRKLYPHEDKRSIAEIFTEQDKRLGVTLLLVRNSLNSVVNRRDTGTIEEKKKEELQRYYQSKSLKGDDPEKKREFQEKLRQQEAEEKRAMNLAKKKELESIRKQIASDKEKIKSKVWVPKSKKPVSDDV